MPAIRSLLRFPRFLRSRRLLLGLAAVLLVVVVIAFSSDDEAETASGPPPPPAQEMSGSISINATSVLKPISRGLYGSHAAWVWDAEGLWDPDRKQLRPNIVEVARDLRPGPIRFPGGIAADFYHWRDGIGPQESRPIRGHGSDKDKSRNGFGTHELVAFTKAIGAEPHLIVNILNGTPQEAAEWVAYCNLPNNPERARNGSPEPFGVRLWEIGNEPYIKAWSKAQKEGQMSAREYADRYLSFASAMKRVDPSIRLMAVGGRNFGRYSFLVDDQWNRTVLERAGHAIDYLAVHNGYTPVLIKKESFDEVYQAMVTFPELVRQDFKTLNRDIETFAPKDAQRIKLAVTEWAPFFAPRKDEHFLGHSKTLGAALFVASMMQVYLTTERMEIANFFKFIDLAFQGCITHEGIPKPSYYALQMYSRYFGELLVASDVQGPTYDFTKAVGGVDPVNNVPYVVSVASLNSNRSKLYMVAVNKHFTNPIRATIRIRGFRPAGRGILRVLTAPSLDANNGPDFPKLGGIKWPKQKKAPYGSMFDEGRPGTVEIRESTIDNVADTFELTIPSKSVIALEIDRRQ